VKGTAFIEKLRKDVAKLLDYCESHTHVNAFVVHDVVSLVPTALGMIRGLAARTASAERERDALREEVREYELNDNCRAKG
jgi:hypothetical protein